MVEWLGWLSSAILVVTLAKQVFKQWKEGQSEGVSVWLFVGQLAASTGFLVYSVLVKNWVFIVTNGLMLVNGVVGFVLTMRQVDKPEKQTNGSARLLKAH